MDSAGCESRGRTMAMSPCKLAPHFVFILPLIQLASCLDMEHYTMLNGSFRT